jgi:hypothetical protein
MRKVVVITIVTLLLGLTIFFWIRYYFVFGEGVKAGNLNFIVRKGYVFKTWEGRLIQPGIISYTPGAVQSNEFTFSITNDSLAKILELNNGKFVELRYKEYLHTLPWRGKSNYIVNEIISIQEDRSNILP